MPEYCKVEKDGRILTVTLNRPKLLNALHPLANSELGEVFEATPRAADSGALALGLGLLQDYNTVETMQERLQSSSVAAEKVHLVQALGLAGRRSVARMR